MSTYYSYYKQNIMYKITSEVNLGLERKQSQSQTQKSCNSHGHKDPVDIMVDRNTGYPNWQRKGEDCHCNHISWRFASNRFATSNGQICDEEYNIRHDVDDESIITCPQTMSDAIFVISWFIAIKSADSRHKNKYGNESKSDQKLTQQSCIHFPDELKIEICIHVNWWRRW